MIPVQFITNATDKFTHEQGAEIALKGGCKWIQMRMKDAPYADKKAAAERIFKLCKEHNAIFIIDDDVELAKVVCADGVHLGKDDMPIDKARRLLGQGMIIGATANKFEDIVTAKQSGVDYVGLGPFRFTETKKKLAPILGISGYEKIMNKINDADIDIPIVAIGGITKDDVAAIIRTGVNGIAISGAILKADDGAEEMKSFLNITTY